MPPYKHKTPFFGIPVLGKGDKISENQELRRANIIENQLLAGTKGIMCCVFEDGEYNYEKLPNGKYKVVLNSTGTSVSLCGIVGGGFVQSRANIEWPGLKSGKKWHIYIRWTDRLFADERAFKPVAFDIQKDPVVSSFLYLATLDLTGASPVLNARPDGKLYSGDIEYHVSDTTNPHGLTLWQERMVVLKELVFEKSYGDTRQAISVINESNVDQFLNRTVVVDTDSGGKEGTVVTIEGAEKILFAQVCQRMTSVGFQDLNEVAIGYHGEDETIVTTNSIKVYNQGLSAIPIRVNVLYR